MRLRGHQSIHAHARAGERPWSTDEREVCRAAELWLRAYDAKKEVVIHDDRAILVRLAAETDGRLWLAGA